MKYFLTCLLLLTFDLFADDANFDMKWDKVPSSYVEGAILGNGEQGTMIWARPEESLHFDIGDTRIYDEGGRLPIGKFILETKSQRESFQMTLAMQTAEAQGTVKTASGAVKFKAISVSGQNLNLVKFTLAGDEQISIKHFAIPGITTSKLRNGIKDISGAPTHTISDYSNPKWAQGIAKTVEKYKPATEVLNDSNGVKTRLVPLKKGKAYSLTWQLKKLSEKEYLLAWRTDYTRENLKAKAQKVWAEKNAQALSQSLEKSYEDYFADHAKWWKNYSQRSNISLPDKKLEAYYKWQLYKVASATRQGKLPIDLMGPWFRATNWPKIWANLNVQLTYLPMAVANQGSIGDTLFQFIDHNPQIFIQPAGKYKSDSATHARAISPYEPGGFSWEYGNFLWTLHNYWHFLRVYPDDKRTVEKFYPMLKRGINFVLHHCRTDEQGFIHTPKDISPEYEMNRVFPKEEDTTYNLEFLRWALRCAVHINHKFQLNDPDGERYAKVVEKLVQPHFDKETGIMIANGVKLEKAHRHYSHLVGLYPLKQMRLDESNKFALAKKSVDYWINLPILNDWSYKGYSRTGAASMYSMLGDGDEAYKQMQILLDTYGSANTMYIESGPVIETPISAAASIHEMLFQAWSHDFNKDHLKLFTGIPKAWKDVSFKDLKAEGGYTLSALRENGAVKSFQIKASTGRFLIFNPGISEAFSVQSSARGEIKSVQEKGQHILKLRIKAGETLTYGDSSELGKSVLGNKGERSYHFGLN